MKLTCPVCECTSTHQYKYEIWDRKEDCKGEYILVEGVDQDNNEPHVDVVNKDIPTGNPSRRRGGIRIHFWCEGCGSLLTMEIYQEKGETFITINGNDWNV